MIVTRIVQYEGDPEWLKKQLGNSMPDGVKYYPYGSISILTVGNCPMVEIYKAVEVPDEIPS